MCTYSVNYVRSSVEDHSFVVLHGGPFKIFMTRGAVLVRMHR